MWHHFPGICSLLVIISITFCVLDAQAAFVQLPHSGQIGCWDENGTPVTCTGTGQAADKRMGVTWPTPRFTDNRNGTVTDNLTGLLWLKNANCFGTQNWSDALTSAKNLASGACGLSDSSTAGQWRLPNVNEIESLLDEQHAGPSMPISHPFVNIQAFYYWSSSSYATAPIDAWGVNVLDGYISNGAKNTPFYVWTVRKGQ